MTADILTQLAGKPDSGRVLYAAIFRPQTQKRVHGHKGGRRGAVALPASPRRIHKLHRALVFHLRVMLGMLYI